MIEPAGCGPTDSSAPEALRQAPPAGRPSSRKSGRRPLALDAGMGTRLVAAGLDLRRDDPALWCLSHPETVAAIHSRDLAGGARAVLSNTFGANRCWLARFGQAHRVELLNRRAVQLARTAPGPDRFVLGSVGPTAGRDPGAAADQARF